MHGPLTIPRGSACLLVGTLALRLGSVGAAAAFPRPALVVEPEATAVLLGIDDHLLPLRRNLALYLSKPEVRAEPVLTPDRGNPKAPDFIATQFYGTVLHDQGRFRMWYYGLWHNHPGDTSRDIPASWFGFNKIACDLSLVISNDGLRFREPAKGHVVVANGVWATRSRVSQTK